MAVRSVKWTTSETEKFIFLLRARPILWDHDHPNYQNKFQRDLSLDEISYEMKTTNEVIRKKINIMRTQYLKEFKKLQSNKDYVPVWRHFKSLKFIFKHNKENLEEEAPIDDGARTENLPTTTAVEIEILDSMDEEGDEEDEEDAIPLKRRRDSTPQSSDDSEPFEDDFDVFGEYVANEMRLLEGHKDIQKDLRMKIITALQEAKVAAIKENKLGRARKIRK